MKLYVASGVRNAPLVKEIMATLKRAGHSITYDWTTHGSVKDAPREFQYQVAHSEIRGVSEADALVVVLPGGFGTHVELGIALAKDKPVFLMSTGDEAFCNFYNHHTVVRCDNIEEVIAKLLWLEDLDRQLSYGIFGGSAQLEGAIGQEETSDFVRVVVPNGLY